MSKHRPPAKRKRGAGPAPKKAKKKVKYDEATLLKKRATALRNLGKANANLNKQADIAEKMKILTLEEQVAKKEAAVAQNRTLAETRGMVEELCKKHEYSPLEELILTAKKKRLKPNEKISIDKYLASKMVPDLKAVDIQADMNMNVNVSIQSFADANIAMMKKVHETIDLTDEDYAEFEDKGLDEQA